VNPLLIIVLPSIFYYQVLKEEEVKGCLRKTMAVIFAIFGFLLLLFFLTLATKNLFVADDAKPNNLPYGLNQNLDL
jgi:hypothetical protein